MLHSMQGLIGFSLGATDGEIGKVKDIYFDDESWRVRYFIVETGNWLFGRKVLISPVAIQVPEWDTGIFPVNLTKDQIKNSPDIDTEKPVSRQQEADLIAYYSWPNYGVAGMGYPTTGMIKGAAALEDKHSTEAHEDKHLRSFKHVKTYKVQNKEVRVGDADDFLVDTETWEIPSLVIKTQQADRDEMVIPTKQIKSINFDGYIIYLASNTDAKI